MYEFLITAFVTLFIIIDPIGLLPLFIALTQGMNKSERRGVALRALTVAFFVLAAFGLAGDALLDFVGIGMPAFRIAGGLLVFLIAVDMLFERRAERREKQSEEPHKPDPSVFPLATPLVAGPGSLAAIILLASGSDGEANSVILTLVAMTGVLLFTFLLFLFANGLERLMGKTLINVVTRLLGMLLAALAVQFVVDGLRSLGALG
jgi:multiple antibiotic resistance protein